MKLSRLKIVGYLLAGAGMIVANELQKRDAREAAEEAVEKALAERDKQDKAVGSAR